MEEASEPESQTSNFGVTRVPTGTESLIVLYKKVCLISLISAVCRDLSCLLLTDWRDSSGDHQMSIFTPLTDLG